MRERWVNSEYRAVIFTLTIIFMIVLTGFFFYKNLTDISKKVSSSIQTEIPASILTEQLLNELHTAENNANSYSLTRDLSSIRAFYKSSPILTNYYLTLKKITTTNYKENQFVDSIILLSCERFILLKLQSYIDDPIKVTNELSLISKKIDETYLASQNDEKNLLQKIEFEDSIRKHKGFFKKLFSKKKEVKDTANIALASISKKNQDSKYKAQLKNAVFKVKSSQIEQLSEYRQSEYKLSQEASQITNRIIHFNDEIKKIEKAEALQATKMINKEVETVKIYSILFSIIISCFLFVLIYLIRSYVKKKSQFELSLLESKLRAEELAKTKETFLANMSHEIKTPLNAISGFTEQILGSDLSPEQARQLTIVKNSANYLTKLVNNILMYAKLQAGKTQLEIINFNVTEEFQEIEELFKSQAKSKGVDFFIKINQSVPTYLAGDLHKIKQIMFNIIGNAMKFTNKGSVHAYLNYAQISDTKFIEIKVIDTGRGIEKDILPILFNEYEQGDNKIHQKYGGTGLGLAITKQLVEQMSGSIELKSEIKVGTEVILKIAVEVPGNSSRIEKSKLEKIKTISHLEGLRVLIADDEEFNRLLLKSILVKQKIRILEAENGSEAVTIAKNSEVDLIIMDVSMPIKNGIDATIEIRKFNKNIPIIASTAVVSEEKIAACMHAGMNDIVFKPFSEKEMIEKIVLILSDDPKEINRSSVTLNHPENTSEKNTIINLESLNNYNDENFRKEMIQIFHKSINKSLIEIEELATKNNYSEISEIAHKIIPSCRHFEAYIILNCLKYFEGLRDQKSFNEKEFSENLMKFKNQITLINAELKVYL